MPAPRRLLLLATAATALAIPAAADATVYCVEKPGCPGLDMTLPSALAEAASTAADDRIELGAVTFPSASHVYDPQVDAGNVEIVGMGRTETILRNQNASEKPALQILDKVGGNKHRVASLGVQIGTSGVLDAYGLSVAGLVEDVTITNPLANNTLMLGLELLAGGELRNSTITLKNAGGDPERFIAVFARGSKNLIDRATLDAGRGVVVEKDTRITRSTIRARGSFGVQVCKSLLRIDNTLVRFQGAVQGILNRASCASGDVLSRTEARQVTLRGDGSAGSVGIECSAYHDEDPSQMLVRGTIIDGVDHDLALYASDPDAACTGDVGSSRLDLTSVKKDGAGTKTLTNAGGNTPVDPGFVNPAVGDFRLKAGSSMIDQGPAGAIDPAVESTLDLAGKPRNVNSKGLGTPRRDIGAYEWQPQGAGFSSGDDPDPDPVPPAGDTPPATDQPAGQEPAAAPGVPAAPAPAPRAGTPAAADTRAPRVSGLRLRTGKRTVRTVGRGRRSSTVLRLLLSEGAKVTIVVERRAGRRWARRATISRSVAAGPRTITLRKALRGAPAGTYRLTVRAVDLAGNRSAPRTLSFRVARR